MLHAIKEAGVYEVNHLLPTRAGFHELDLAAFSQKLFPLAPQADSQEATGSASIRLKAILCGHHDFTSTKLNVLQAILARKITIVGAENGTIGGLLLGRVAYREFTVDLRLIAAENAAIH